jgi:hypothetical protein
VTDRSGGAEKARRLIGDVQRFGLLSAAAVVDRFTEMVDEAVGGSTSGRRASGDAERFVADTARLVEAYLRFLDSGAGLLAVKAEDGGGTATDRVVLPAIAAGGVAESTVWVHNTTAQPGLDISFHPSQLIGPGGAKIGRRATTVAPSRIERLEAGASSELAVRVEVPVDAAPGGYHGVILTSSPPGATIAVQLEVRAP